MLKKRATQTVLWLVGLAFLGGMGWIFGGGNTWDLWQMNRSLGAVKHPADTQLVASSSDVGLLTGNGNHCDFFVGELRSYANTSLSPVQLRRIYANTMIWNPRSGRRQRISVATVEGQRLNSDGEDAEFLGRRFGTSWPPALNNQKLYVVFVFDPGYEAGCDFRCT